MDYAQQVMAWAHERDDIRVVIQAGSRTRTVLPADEWSDYDIECYTDSYAEYAGEQAFVQQFGTIWLALPYTRGDGFPEQLIVYEGGTKVDISFLPLSFLQTMINEERLYTVYQRGYRVLLDKDSITDNLPAPQARVISTETPSAAEYQRVQRFFWYGAHMVAKQLRKGQLWVTQTAQDRIRREILTMLEWYGQIQGQDTWYDGRFIQHWLDDPYSKQLAGLFAEFNAASSWNALFNAIELFRDIALAVAMHYNYDYPNAVDANITRYIENLHQGTQSNG